MTNFKYLQKLFFLLVMGFSLSFVCACGDDEDDEPFDDSDQEQTDNGGGTGNGGTTPTDSIVPPAEEPVLPNDSIAGGEDEPIVSPTDSIEYEYHEAVDLGLSVKWATCNVGASSPEEAGGYYAWGETEEKSDYDWDTYKWCNGTDVSMTKYCTNSSYGIVDNKSRLDSEDDVAHVKWGGSWRMPTLDETNELISKCVWKWTTYNGVNGQLVTGPNGNSIFLPAVGYRYGTRFIGLGEDGCYWSAALYEDKSSDAYGPGFFGSNYWGLGRYGRSNGHTVRPVTE